MQRKWKQDLEEVSAILWFIVASFTIAKTWKQPKCPSTHEWIKKTWYIIYNGILTSLKKEQNNAICGNMDTTRDYHTK